MLSSTQLLIFVCHKVPVRITTVSVLVAELLFLMVKLHYVHGSQGIFVSIGYFSLVQTCLL